MAPKLCVVDTNVVVSALIGADASSPPARILDAMIVGKFPYLMSDDLLLEYASVLRRPGIVRMHGRTDEQLDGLLADLVANALWRVPSGSHDAPHRGDDHLWALLGGETQGLLVTGDRLLLQNPPSNASVVSPRVFVDTFLSD